MPPTDRRRARRGAWNRPGPGDRDTLAAHAGTEDTLDLKLTEELLALIAEDRRHGSSPARPRRPTCSAPRPPGAGVDHPRRGLPPGPGAARSATWPLLSRWMNDPAVAAFWELAGPAVRHRRPPAGPARRRRPQHPLPRRPRRHTHELLGDLPRRPRPARPPLPGPPPRHGHPPAHRRRARTAGAGSAPPCSAPSPTSCWTTARAAPRRRRTGPAQHPLRIGLPERRIPLLRGSRPPRQAGRPDDPRPSRYRDHL